MALALGLALAMYGYGMSLALRCVVMRNALGGQTIPSVSSSPWHRPPPPPPSASHFASVFLDVLLVRHVIVAIS